MKDKHERDSNQCPPIYIIVLNYNGWADTIACLESIYKNHYPHYKAVVVDNNSPNRSMDYIISWAEGKLTPWTGPDYELKRLIYPELKKPVEYIFCRSRDPQYEKPRSNNARLVLIQTGGNLGFAGGVNTGIRYALNENADFVWVLANDTLIEPDSLNELYTVSEKNGHKKIIGSVLYYADRTNEIQAWGGGTVDFTRGFTKHLTALGKADYLTGASLLIPRKILESTGLFDEGFFMYWEDVDYSIRAKKAGWGIDVAEKSIIYHRHNVAANEAIKKNSSFGDIQTGRGVVRFFIKHRGVPGIVPVMYRIAAGIWRRLKKGDFSQFILLPKVMIKSLIKVIFNKPDTG